MVANKIKATPSARREARENSINIEKLIGSGPNGRIHLVDILDYINKNKVKVTPLAKRISEDLNIDLESIIGSGYRKKITKIDLGINEFKESSQGYETKNTFNSVQGEYIPLNPMRQTVAKRMSESYFNVPAFTMNIEVDITDLKEAKNYLSEAIKENSGEKLTLTDLILMATGKTLTKHPALNSAWTENSIFRYGEINIALAIGLEEGLYVPVIKNVDKKSLSQLTKESKDLIKKVNSGKLMPYEQEGNTFTISNIGMYGIVSSTPIINMPSSAILGVGASSDRYLPINEEMKIRSIMTLSLTADHRIVDGAPAAKFLQDLKNLLEKPFKMLV